MAEHFTAKPCPCDYERCPDWHVSPVAEMQGVKFTEADARAVAAMLNERHRDNG